MKLSVACGLTLGACLVAVPAFVFAGSSSPAAAPQVSAQQAAGQSTPAAESADIAGKWHFVYNTDGGDRESTADFKVDGIQVTGKWNNTADVKGTWQNGDLDLAFPYESDEANMKSTLKMKGKMKDGKLVGNWEFADYSGTFSATREK